MPYRLDERSHESSQICCLTWLPPERSLSRGLNHLDVDNFASESSEVADYHACPEYPQNPWEIQERVSGDGAMQVEPLIALADANPSSLRALNHRIHGLRTAKPNPVFPNVLPE
jgi:hypothetical protein